MDVCASPEAHVELDLSEARVYREHERVRVTLHPTGSGRCREPGIAQLTSEQRVGDQIERRDGASLSSRMSEVPHWHDYF